jgi:hypothetical protein
MLAFGSNRDAEEALPLPEVWLLSQAQRRRIEPYFPLSHFSPPVDHRSLVSGIIFVIRNGLRWRDAPTAQGLRCRLVPPCLGRACHRCLHPVETQLQSALPIRPQPLPPALKGGKNVRQTQGVAGHLHLLRPLRLHLDVRHLHRRNPHLLAATMNPEPMHNERCSHAAKFLPQRQAIRACPVPIAWGWRA